MLSKKKETPATLNTKFFTAMNYKEFDNKELDNFTILTECSNLYWYFNTNMMLLNIIVIVLNGNWSIIKIKKESVKDIDPAKYFCGD